IQKIQPEIIPFELLDFNLGERWIPSRYYSEFATSLFEKDTNVKYFRSVDAFKVSYEGQNVKTSSEFSVTPKSGRKTYGNTLFEHAIENTSPLYTYEVKNVDGSTSRKPDNDAIQLAHQKIENIRGKFITYLKELPEKEKAFLETYYNKLFNCYVLREYNGDHQKFPKLDYKSLGIQDLYSSQKNSVWRIVQNRGALIDHEVGLGKTLTMIVASMEMKRLGIVNKPMIIALKANVEQIADTYRKAYPNARLLAPGQEDLTPAKRKRIFNEITNNNWDCIILTHDQFGKIPQSPEIMQSIYKSEIHNIKQDLKTLKDMGRDIDKRLLRGMEVRKLNLMNKLKEITDAIEGKKDLGINFIDMGIDHLFVDESHKFKNLTFTTRHERVSGLGNITGSQKALNMLFAVRTLQKKFDSDLCFTFLSGTPISNSLTELYLLFKYLTPRELERQAIENFDGWAAVFARKTSDFEFSVTNEIISKERFRNFIKLPELALSYNEVTDYKTAKHIQLDKPELKEILVNIKPTPDQIEFTKNLMAFARSGNAQLIGRASLTKEEDKGRMLIATNYAKKMATDMRLIDESYEDHPDNKVNICARKVAEIYQQSNDYKGTQIIFSDLGTPKPGFNLYDELKQKLIENFNIPPHEITFVHDWSAKKKPELFTKMNNGEIRILIGSTEKAGTGLNVQERVVALHHMDIPWKPSELEQRFGRGARQGNWAAKLHNGNKVFNFIYATERSLDNYKFNLLRNKLIFISQMKNSELSVRSIDEGSIDEKNGMNFSEYIAILSGDTTLLEKSKVEKKILAIESLKSAHFREVYKTKFDLDEMKSLFVKTSKLLEELDLDGKLYKGALQFDKDGTKLNPIQLTGFKSADPEQIGNYLIIQSGHWKEGQEKESLAKIGTLYGFDLIIQRKAKMDYENGRTVFQFVNLLYAQRPGGDIKYNLNSGYPNLEHPKLAARYFLNAIDKIDYLMVKNKKTLAELQENIPNLETLLNKPFEKEKELQELKTSLSKLELEISVNIQAKQMELSAVGFDDHSMAKLSVVPTSFSMLLKPEIIHIDSLRKTVNALKDESISKEKRFKQIRIRA
ncbi:helicase-related protein, partial [Pedobacter sp.]|uniref:helicase-related protein n=1 Tax=Pedobacter sp. TaxID=1411316 RepID=UPI002BE3BEC2